MTSSSQVRPLPVLAVLMAVLAVACSLFPCAGRAYAVTAAEKEAEAQEALNELHAMQSTLEQTSKKYYKSLSEYQEAKDRCDEAQASIDEISAKIAVIQGRLGERARDMYRTGSSSFIDLLLGAASFDEFSTNWELLNRVNANDAQLSSEARTYRSQVEEKKAEYAEQASIAEEKSKEAGKAFAESQELVAQMETTYDALSKEAAELYRQEQEAAAIAAQLAAEQAAAEQAAAEQYAGQDVVVDGGIQNEDGTVTDAATGETYASATEYSSATGNEVVDRAMSMLGASYKYGSSGYDGSFDCSGLVGYALTGSYERIGNTTTFMGYNQVSDPQPGDVVVSEGHTGIYIGDGQMIHAADENTGVVVGNVQSDMIYVRP